MNAGVIVTLCIGLATLLLAILGGVIKSAQQATATRSGVESLKESLVRIERNQEKTELRVDTMDSRVRVVETGLGVLQGSVRDLQTQQMQMHQDNNLAMRQVVETVLTRTTERDREGGH